MESDWCFITVGVGRPPEQEYWIRPLTGHRPGDRRLWSALEPRAAWPVPREGPLLSAAWCWARQALRQGHQPLRRVSPGASGHQYRSPQREQRGFLWGGGTWHPAHPRPEQSLLPSVPLSSCLPLPQCASFSASAPRGPELGCSSSQSARLPRVRVNLPLPVLSTGRMAGGHWVVQGQGPSAQSSCWRPSGEQWRSGPRPWIGDWQPPAYSATLCCSNRLECGTSTSLGRPIGRGLRCCARRCPRGARLVCSSFVRILCLRPRGIPWGSSCAVFGWWWC